MTSLHKLAAETAQQFVKAFGRPPRWIVAAPGRVNVIGEHTDYNDGFVLPMAIEYYAVMAADRPSGGANHQFQTTGEVVREALRVLASATLVQIRSTAEKEVASIDTSKPITKS